MGAGQQSAARAAADAAAQQQAAQAAQANAAAGQDAVNQRQGRRGKEAMTDREKEEAELDQTMSSVFTFNLDGTPAWRAEAGKYLAHMTTADKAKFLKTTWFLNGSYGHTLAVNLLANPEGFIGAALGAAVKWLFQRHAHRKIKTLSEEARNRAEEAGIKASENNAASGKFDANVGSKSPNYAIGDNLSPKQAKELDPHVNGFWEKLNPARLENPDAAVDAPKLKGLESGQPSVLSEAEQDFVHTWRVKAIQMLDPQALSDPKAQSAAAVGQGQGMGATAQAFFDQFEQELANGKEFQRLAKGLTPEEREALKLKLARAALADIGLGDILEKGRVRDFETVVDGTVSPSEVAEAKDHLGMAADFDLKAWACQADLEGQNLDLKDSASVAERMRLIRSTNLPLETRFGLSLHLLDQHLAADVPSLETQLERIQALSEEKDARGDPVMDPAVLQEMKLDVVRGDLAKDDRLKLSGGLKSEEHEEYLNILRAQLQKELEQHEADGYIDTRERLEIQRRLVAQYNNDNKDVADFKRAEPIQLNNADCHALMAVENPETALSDREVADLRNYAAQSTKGKGVDAATQSTVKEANDFLKKHFPVAASTRPSPGPGVSGEIGLEAEAARKRELAAELRRTADGPAVGSP